MRNNTNTSKQALHEMELTREAEEEREAKKQLATVMINCGGNERGSLQLATC